MKIEIYFLLNYIISVNDKSSLYIVFKYRDDKIIFLYFSIFSLKILAYNQ